MCLVTITAKPQVTMFLFLSVLNSWSFELFHQSTLPWNEWPCAQTFSYIWEHVHCHMWCGIIQAHSLPWIQGNLIIRETSKKSATSFNKLVILSCTQDVAACGFLWSWELICCLPLLYFFFSFVYFCFAWFIFNCQIIYFCFFSSYHLGIFFLIYLSTLASALAICLPVFPAMNLPLLFFHFLRQWIHSV